MNSTNWLSGIGRAGRLGLALAVVALWAPGAGAAEPIVVAIQVEDAGLMPSEMKRLRLLEEENVKLKKIVADLSLDKAMLQDVIRRKL